MKNPIPATIQKVETMARCARIIVDTQETLTPAQLAELFALHEKVGYFFLFEDPSRMQVDASKLPAIQLEEGEKSPSQRLRATMYVFWDQNVRGRKADAYSTDFELFYKREMEKIIDQVKERLA